jgi:hypothetical protein
MREHIERLEAAGAPGLGGHMLDVTIISIATVLHASADQILGIRPSKTAVKEVSLRLAKRMNAIEALPEVTKKHILKTLDDSIKANEEPRRKH